MEEIVTVGGKQFKLTTDRPLTALERRQTIEQIQRQTGCSSCGPRTMSAGFGDGNIYGLADSCTASTKASGDTITLSAAPDTGVAPYFVRFWRKPTSAGAMAWEELGGTRTVLTDGATTGTSFTLYDLDVASADGHTAAAVLLTDTEGTLTEGTTAFTLSAGIIRVATTVYDSCPVTPMTCVTSCDVSLACIAPTCNFVVT